MNCMLSGRKLLISRRNWLYLRHGRLHLSARSKHSRSYAASAKDRNVKNACVGTGGLRVGPRIIARHYHHRVDLDHTLMPPLSLSRGTEVRIHLPPAASHVRT